MFLLFIDSFSSRYYFFFLLNLFTLSRFRSVTSSVCRSTLSFSLLFSFILSIYLSLSLSLLNFTQAFSFLSLSLSRNTVYIHS